VEHVWAVEAFVGIVVDAVGVIAGVAVGVADWLGDVHPSTADVASNTNNTVNMAVILHDLMLSHLSECWRFCGRQAKMETPTL